MLKDTFPQLLRGEAAPQDPAVWELSRFAVQPRDGSSTAQASLNGVTFSMLRAAYDYAVRHHIRSYVTVTSVALERLMIKAGVPIKRFADKKAQRIGKVLTVACWIDIDERLHDALYEGRTAARVLQDVA